MIFRDLPMIFITQNSMTLTHIRGIFGDLTSLKETSTVSREDILGGHCWMFSELTESMFISCWAKRHSPSESFVIRAAVVVIRGVRPPPEVSGHHRAAVNTGKNYFAGLGSTFKYRIISKHSLLIKFFWACFFNNNSADSDSMLNLLKCCTNISLTQL